MEPTDVPEPVEADHLQQRCCRQLAVQILLVLDEARKRQRVGIALLVGQRGGCPLPGRWWTPLYVEVSGCRILRLKADTDGPLVNQAGSLPRTHIPHVVVAIG